MAVRLARIRGRARKYAGASFLASPATPVYCTLRAASGSTTTPHHLPLFRTPDTLYFAPSFLPFVVGDASRFRPHTSRVSTHPISLYLFFKVFLARLCIFPLNQVLTVMFFLYFFSLFLSRKLLFAAPVYFLFFHCTFFYFSASRSGVLVLLLCVWFLRATYFNSSALVYCDEKLKIFFLFFNNDMVLGKVPVYHR